jgi:hypothetical protein
MFREIKRVQQRAQGERKRWFQDSFFDLYVVQDLLGNVQWFQLCYLRDTRRERVLEWKRGRGFQHLKVTQPSFAGDRESGALVPDGAMPHCEVLDRFAISAGGLPPALAAFVSDKVREHQRPSYRFRRLGTKVPRWLERLRRG